MDLNLLRSIVTVVSLLTFLGIVAWAWSARRRAAFDDAAMLPLREELPVDGSPAVLPTARRHGGRDE